MLSFNLLMQPTHSIRRKLATGALITSLSFAAIAMPLTSARAHEGEDHGPGAAHFKTSAEAWNAAQGSVKSIESMVAAKNLKPIHDEQEKLDAALNYLQAHIKDAADKGRFDGAIKNATAASGRLHEAADAGDQAKVESGLKTLQSTIAMVEKQLPASAK